MTVAELIAELQKIPADQDHLPVQIVYDSAVCSRDIVLVRPWFPDAYMQDDGGKGKRCVGLFEESSAYEASDDPVDKRFVK